MVLLSPSSPSLKMKIKIEEVLGIKRENSVCLSCRYLGFTDQWDEYDLVA